MAQPRHDPAVVSQDRADDEKTIHAEPLDSEKKDLEAGRTHSYAGSGADSVKLQEVNQDAEFTLEDDYPEGGVKAWTVVLGVRSLSSISPSHR